MGRKESNQTNKTKILPFVLEVECNMIFQLQTMLSFREQNIFCHVFYKHISNYSSLYLVFVPLLKMAVTLPFFQM